MCAEGASTINNADQIERGYERIDERLNALGRQGITPACRNDRNRSESMLWPPSRERLDASSWQLIAKLSQAETRHLRILADHAAPRCAASVTWKMLLLMLTAHG